MSISSRKSQQGATLIVVLLLLMVMMILALSLSSNSSTHTQMANKSVLKAQAFQAAEAGSDIVLNYLQSDTNALVALQKRTCDKIFTEQYTAEYQDKDGKSLPNNIIKTSSEKAKRKIKSAWYACYPQNQKEISCGTGTCFAVIIAGVSCPDDGADKMTITDACVISRHLQGYRVDSGN